ncbi:alpha/beta hydrolase fold domain-containing protein [Nonomuraea muscovyensis]|uniref:Acetyl esterase n=1 Tax=Nonomuraea muscovyensis TaxID=1124761 RepID=A0A7X0C5W4_9ACTN|nr:alpha/beta hydrolase fold domain-containing protein [Nonomuraea muscovyensis]MBB6348030.1 acetyl esterase [Nonomuraea muscovyensis]MDF2709961.1 esterase/lipase [Nonomuraea muscovyensis]
MSVLGTPWVAAAVARVMQALATAASALAGRRRQVMFPQFQGDTEEITIPTSIAPARAIVYRPAGQDPCPPVHVNFHGGGFVMRGVHFDDPLCRYLAAEAGVVVVNVDYAVAPQHPFPAPPHQAFETVRWVAEHGADHGWDGGRLTVGGQSAGGALAAAVARQALERGGPPIALQVLHYPPLDLVTPAGAKRSVIARPTLRPWMGEVFDNAYVPDPGVRADRLVSPAHPADTADLTGIAPALVITPAFDRLHAEGTRYAQRLAAAGALVEHRDVPQADHGYDMNDADKAGQTYALIARCLRQAAEPRSGD